MVQFDDLIACSSPLINRPMFERCLRSTSAAMAIVMIIGAEALTNRSVVPTASCASPCAMNSEINVAMGTIIAAAMLASEMTLVQTGVGFSSATLTTTAADCGERLEGQCESVELRRCVTHRVRAKLRVAVPASLRAYERGTQSNPTTNCAPLEAKGHDAISVVRRRDNFGWQRGWPFCWLRRQINDCLTIDPLLCLGTTVK